MIVKLMQPDSDMPLTKERFTDQEDSIWRKYKALTLKERKPLFSNGAGYK